MKFAKFNLPKMPKLRFSTGFKFASLTQYFKSNNWRELFSRQTWQVLNWREFRQGLTKRNLTFASGVLVLGLYVGSLLFGHNGVLDLVSLQAKARDLTMRVELLKQQNAVLHKRYFESIILQKAQKN